MPNDHLLRSPAFLATHQYADSRNLGNRSSLHDRYSSAAEPFRVWEARLVDWSDGIEVLEVGAGPGQFWTSGMVPRSAHVTVSDLSPGMVREAVARVTEEGYASTSGLVCDALALPCADAQYDMVVANHMLYHVPDPAAALAEFRRVLRPGGTALIATNAPGHMRQLSEVITDVYGSSSSILNSVFGIDNGELMLRDHFTAIVWHSFVNPLMVNDVGALVAYASSLPPVSTGAPDQLQELRRAFEARLSADGGQFRIDTRAGAFVCRT